MIIENRYFAVSTTAKNNGVYIFGRVKSDIQNSEWVYHFFKDPNLFLPFKSIESLKKCIEYRFEDFSKYKYEIVKSENVHFLGGNLVIIDHDENIL